MKKIFAWKAVMAFVLVLPTLAQAAEVPRSFAGLAEKLLPSVVNVSTTQKMTSSGRTKTEQCPLPPWVPQRLEATSLGSGFVIDSARGYVVTNNHVIDDAREISVILQNGSTLKAEVAGRDRKTDIAVLKVAGKLPSALAWGDSDTARVGDWTLAIGNPFGLGGSVTAGIISARARDINAGPYDDFLQTDASINHGNSGGPLFNMGGEVIGINTALYSPSCGSVGIGFAIPSSLARPLILQIINRGRAMRGWIGVNIQDVTDGIAESLGMNAPVGAMVSGISEGGPAEAAGIAVGDVIIHFDGKNVPDVHHLPRMVADAEIGSKVDLDVLHNGKGKTLSVRVGELPPDDGRGKALPAIGDAGKDRPGKLEDFGLIISALDDAARKQLGLAREVRGVLVVTVDEAGVAAERDLQVGDVIQSVGMENVSSVAEVVAKVKRAKDAGRMQVLLLVVRGSSSLFVTLPFPGKE